MAIAHKIADELALAADAAQDGLDFSAVYHRWFPSVYRWVRALVGPYADVEDLAQEVFVVVQRKLPQFDGRNLAGWLYRITQRTASDYRRRSWFRNVFLRPREVVLDTFETTTATSEEMLQQKQEQQQFYRLVSGLNKKWRDSFILFEIDGYTGEEIAAIQGIPAATVRTHLHRARKEFLELVAKELRS